MNNSLTEYINQLNQFLESDDLEKQLIYINGTFGIGKTHLIKNFIISLENPDCDIYYFSLNTGIDYIHEFVYGLAMSSISISEKKIDPQESFYNRNFFLNMLNQAYTIDKQLHKLIKQINRLRNVPNFLSFNHEKPGTNPLLEDKSFKPDEIRLLFEPESLLAESFVVDLLHKYDEYFKQYNYKKPEKPQKLLFVIDNYDRIAGSANNWLFKSLHKVVNQTKFGDFINFEVKQYPNDLKPSDYISIRFIIAGREELLPFDNSFQYDKIMIEPFSKFETIELFEKNNLNIKDNYKLIEKVSQGIPFVLVLFIEAFNIGDVEMQDLTNMEHLIALQLMNYLSPIEQDWLRAAVFLDEFDEHTLGYLPLIKEHSEFAFQFFGNSTFLATKLANDNISIKKNIRKFVKSLVTIESEVILEKFVEIAKQIKINNDLLNRFNPKERQIIFKLSLFKNFDKIYSIQDIFADDAGAVRRFIENHPQIFLQNKFTYSVRDDIVSSVFRLESLSQSDEYFNILNKINQLWERYRKNLNDSLLKINEQLGDISNEADELANKQIELSEKLDFEQKEKENHLQRISNFEKLTKEYEKDISISMFAIPAIISVILLWMLLLSKFNLSSTITYSLWSMSATLLGYAAFKISKYFIAKSKRLDYISNSSKLYAHKTLLEDLEKKHKNSEQEIKKNSERFTKLQELKEKLSEEINSIKQKFGEPFIREEAYH